MIQVEKAKTTGELRTGLRQLLDALDQVGLRKLTPDVETWVRRVIRPKRFQDMDLSSMRDMSEVATMLEERVKQWEKELLTQGRVEGLVIGRIDGLRSAFRSQFRLKFQRSLHDSESTALKEANQSQVEGLLKRILTADSPSDLFE